MIYKDTHSPSLPTHLEFTRIQSPEHMIPYSGQLIENSLQPHITQFESEDSAEGGRFSSKSAIRSWMMQDRAVWLLTDPTYLTADDMPSIAGITWFSPREYTPDPSRLLTMTYGVRLYEGYAGNGYGNDYIRASHEVAREYIGKNILWLSVNQFNRKAISLYERNGYVQDVVHTDGLVYMYQKDFVDPLKGALMPERIAS